jgi:hypothetical protein
VLGLRSVSFCAEIFRAGLGHHGQFFRSVLGPWCFEVGRARLRLNLLLLEAIRHSLTIHPFYNLIFEWLQFIFRISLRFQAFGPVRPVGPKTKRSGQSQAFPRPKLLRSVRSLPLVFGLARVFGPHGWTSIRSDWTAARPNRPAPSLPRLCIFDIDISMV